MSRRLALTLAMLVAGTALLVTSGLARPAGSASAAGEVRKGGVLRMGAPGDLDFVDPALAYQPRSMSLGFATCARLFNYPDEPRADGTRLVQEVVDQFTVTKDGRTYIFDLKKTFRFHTGAPVTAQSFADALNRVANPKLESPATAYMREIVGATEVIEGRATLITGIRVLGRYRLQIRLTRPLGDFTARLSMGFFCPVLPKTPIAASETPAGSGPYYVDERIPNQRIILKRNPFYRGDRPANVNQVVWTLNLSDAACALAVERDEIDHCYFGLGSASMFRALADKYGINQRRFFVSQRLGASLVVFNHARPAFRGAGQIPLKKAINYAIDRPEIVRKHGYLAGKRTGQLLPPALARSASAYPLKAADPATARKLLARAGHQPTTLILYAYSQSTEVAAAQTLVYNLRQIGIDVEVKYYDITTLPAKLATPGEPFDLALTGWIADYADPASFFVPLLARGSRVLGVNLDDPRLNRQIDAANSMKGDARHKAWADLDIDLMRDNPPWAPIFHVNLRSFVSRSVGCVVDHPVYGFDVAAACKK